MKTTGASNVRYAAILFVLFCLAGCPLHSVLAPDVVGLVLQTGEDRIVANGLAVGAITYVYSDTIAAYIIIQQDPGAGTVMDIGEAINLVVSRGASDASSSWTAEANPYSWDGSWIPDDSDLPPEGLFDAIYCDEHDVEGVPSPLLPPGAWDRPGELLGRWATFQERIGRFKLLKDNNLKAYGWQLLLPESTSEPVINYYVDVFAGSSGTDIFDLGPTGRITQTDGFTLGDGPDMIRFRYASAANWRTGSDADGGAHDNDLVIGGSLPALNAGAFDITSSTVHTGPGSDLLIISNIGHAAIDAGNGASGRTDTIDPIDGDDWVLVRGNAYDFRVFGGGGEDTFVWYVDEGIQTTAWLGASFFGAGGWGSAVWDDTVDRLVLMVPADTPVVNNLSVNDLGSVSIGIPTDYSVIPVPDEPTSENGFTRYYATAGIGTAGQKTVVFRYTSMDQTISTGYCYLTAIEEIQIGFGATAKVYRIDQTNGTATEDPTAIPIPSLPDRNALINRMEHFVR